MNSRTILTILILTISQLGFSQFNAGGGLTYVEKQNDVGIGAKAILGLAEFWGACLGADLFFTNGVKFDVNADAHYRLRIGENTAINPLLGLNFTKFSENSDLDIGINLGLFTLIPLQDRLNLYIEPKLTVGTFNSFVLSAGVML